MVLAPLAEILTFFGQCLKRGLPVIGRICLTNRQSVFTVVCVVFTFRGRISMRPRQDRVAEARTFDRPPGVRSRMPLVACFLAWLTAWHASSCCHAEDRQEIGSQAESEAKVESGLATQLARDEVDKWHLRAASGEPATFTLIDDPVLRWTNPYVGRVYGSVFLWTTDGRPAAIASVFKWFSPRDEFYIELKSLSPERLSGSRGGREVWQSRPAQIEWSVLTGAAAPRDSARERLQQMRELARDFSAELIDRRDDADGRKVQLRLLPQPIFRFNEAKRPSSDGALFCFVQGTDPEVLLLLQVDRKGASPEWEYSFARLNTDELKVRHGSEEVWHVEPLDFTRKGPDDDYVLFRISDDGVRR